MEIRDAVEDDAARLSELTGAPTRVARELVHDRTTRIATAENRTKGNDDRGDDGGGDGDEGEDSGSRDRVLGVVSFDARRDAVHVTQLAGTRAAVARLLDEPIGFAEREGMAVEVVLETGEDDARKAVTDAGFYRAGSGPRFEGSETVAFRLDP